PGVLERPPEGWHDTGDIVTIDAEGFIAIKGRAKRFAKIGGEMISLAAIGSLARRARPDAPARLPRVARGPHGGRIRPGTTRRDATRAAFQAFAKSRGAPELMIPAEIMVVEKLPLLGSGKIDNVALTAMVRERARLEGAA